MSQSAGRNCTPSVLESAAQIPELTLSVSLIQRAKLEDIFACPGPFTALLPTNAAWDALEPTFLQFLLLPENQKSLEDILLYHILPEAIPSSSFQAGMIGTLLGEDLTVSLNPLLFNGVAVKTADITVCNGVIHALGGVLVPFQTRKINRVISFL
jgi:uncharacterized surface protein with fasciclin (FAS1) repeats